jgi:hypothetical protein
MGAAVSVMPLKVIPFRLFVEFMGASPGSGSGGQLAHDTGL